MRAKYYIPIIWLTLLIVFVFGAFFKLIQIDATRAALNEKAMERQINLDIIGSQIDRFIELDDDWDSYDYKSIVAYSLEYLDNLDMTFAAAYDANFKELSERAPSYINAPFEPIEQAAFLDAIAENESGMIDLWYEAEGVTGRTMKTAWKWIPTDNSLDNRFLLVVAVSEYSIQNAAFDWVLIGTAMVTFVTGGALLLLASLFVPKSTSTRKRRKEKTDGQ